jgi:hypothetical protein
MAHYSAMIRVSGSISVDEVEDAVGKILSFYDENNGEVFDFIDRHEQALEEYENGVIKGVLIGNRFKFDWQLGPGVTPSDYPANEIYSTFGEFCQHYHSYYERDGRWGYVANPNGFFDEYIIGGRWAGHIPIKVNVTEHVGEETFDVREGGSDIARIRDIDFERVKGETQANMSSFLEWYKGACETGETSDKKVAGQRLVAVEAGLITIGFGGKETLIPFKDIDDAMRKRIAHRLHALRTFAFVDSEKWVSPDIKTVFSVAEVTNEVDYVDEFLTWIRSGDDSDWVVVVDCQLT